MATRGERRDARATIGAAVDGAETVVPIGRAGRSAPAPEPRDAPPVDEQGGDGNGEGAALLLGDDCPVVPLGTSQGLYFYLSTLRELRTLKAKEHDGRNIQSLFAPRTGMLTELFPRYGKNKVVTGWDKEGVGEKLMNACAERGVWTAEGRVRGAGAHRDAEGGLILHCGDMIQVPSTDPSDLPHLNRHDRRVLASVERRAWRWVTPGLIDGMVYPASQKGPRPWVEPVGPEVAAQVLALLRTWSWERPEVDPRLALGWIGAAMVCGALDWRPAMWLTGGRGTGKSTLQKLIKMLMGDGGLIDAVSATEAYIRQLLGHRTLPVALDELEADASNQKQQAIITLARLAASGGKMGKGGSDHNPHEFTARSSFLFSSILTVPLAPQDKSRIAVLDLLPLAEDARPPVIDAKTYNEIGRKLRRRMVDQWDRLEGVIEAYRAELGRNGLDARGQDQMGALLACGDVLLYDHEPDAEDEEYARWGAALAVDRVAAAEDDEPFLVIQHLSTTALAGRGGDEPETAAMWVAKLLDPYLDGTGSTVHAEKAQKRLEMSGLLVVSSDVADGRRRTRRWLGTGNAGPGAVALYVAVASSHRGLDALLRDTRWQGGVWNQALGRMPGAVKRQKVRLGGRPEWTTLVPIAAFASAPEKAE